MRYGVIALDIMTRNPITASQKDKVFDAVKKMMKHNVGSLLIVENNKLLGIVTEKDVLQKVVAKNMDPKTLSLKKIMSKKVRTIKPRDDLFDIARLMSDKNIRRLPVVAGGKLFGLVTIKDLLKAEPHVIEVLADKLRIRGPQFDVGEEEVLEGGCDMCGNYSDLLKEIDGAMICPQCADTM